MFRLRWPLGAPRNTSRQISPSETMHPTRQMQTMAISPRAEHAITGKTVSGRDSRRCSTAEAGLAQTIRFSPPGGVHAATVRYNRWAALRP